MSIDKLIERLRGGTMRFDWSDIPDDALIPAVPLLREAAKLIERLRGGTMRFDWSDIADDALIPAVPLLREAASEAASALERAESEILRLKAALAPFAAMAAASDKLAVEGQRRLQPKESAELTDAEIASLVMPDDQVVMTDGRMAFGHDQHPSKPARVTIGDLRRAARSLS
jgi:hypothetical protein